MTVDPFGPDIRNDLASLELAVCELEAAKRSRRTFILAAHEAGASLRQIAKAAGLSHQRVAQIIDESKEDA